MTSTILILVAPIVATASCLTRSILVYRAALVDQMLG